MDFVAWLAPESCCYMLPCYSFHFHQTSIALVAHTKICGRKPLECPSESCYVHPSRTPTCLQNKKHQLQIPGSVGQMWFRVGGGKLNRNCLSRQSIDNLTFWATSAPFPLPNIHRCKQSITIKISSWVARPLFNAVVIVLATRETTVAMNWAQIAKSNRGKE